MFCFGFKEIFVKLTDNVLAWEIISRLSVFFFVFVFFTYFFLQCWHCVISSILCLFTCCVGDFCYNRIVHVYLFKISQMTTDMVFHQCLKFKLKQIHLCGIIWNEALWRIQSINGKNTYYLFNRLLLIMSRKKNLYITCHSNLSIKSFKELILINCLYN